MRGIADMSIDRPAGQFDDSGLSNAFSSASPAAGDGGRPIFPLGVLFQS